MEVDVVEGTVMLRAETLAHGQHVLFVVLSFDVMGVCACLRCEWHQNNHLSGDV